MRTTVFLFDVLQDKAFQWVLASSAFKRIQKRGCKIEVAGNEDYPAWATRGPCALYMAIAEPIISVINILRYMYYDV
jgi:hypothetical protein